MERAHVLAWPAVRTANVEGWLWRSSGGGSQRANSASTIDFTGSTIKTAVTEVEARYHAVGSPPRFHTFEDTSPPDLVKHLQDSLYRQTESTVTMFKRFGKATAIPSVETRNHSWDLWRQVYLAEITHDRRAANAVILDQVPAPRAFFAGSQNGQIVSTALCVISFGCAVIECVATRPEARRHGTARAVLSAVEHWASKQEADLIGLQVAQGNIPARSLYHSLGFTDGQKIIFGLQLIIRQQ